MRNRVCRCWSVVSAAAVLGIAPAAIAHPLGNNSVTHFSVLYFYPDRVELDFLLDIAEIPSATIRATEIDLDKDGEDTIEEQKAWLDRKAAAFLKDLSMTLDGKPLAITPVGATPTEETPGAAPTTQPGESDTNEPPKRIIMKLPGFAEMPTYRTLIRYEAKLPALAPGERHTLTYTDRVYPQDRGLKRVILEKPEGVTVHEKDRQFWDEGPDPFLYDLYDPGNMPQERTARVVFSVEAAAGGEAAGEAGTGTEDEAAVAAAPAAEAGESATSAPYTARETAAPPTWKRFTDPRNNPARANTYRRQATRIADIFAGRLSLGALALIAALCFGYGAVHALAPGHAKTIVAAYLISLHGRYWHAVLLAIIVTITHSALVVIVGLVFLIVSPQAGSTLQLWLGFAAGAIIAAMGGWLMFRALTGRLHHHHHDPAPEHHGHVHDAAHSHTHPHHHDHGHEHGHEHEPEHGPAPERPTTLRGWLRMLFTHSHPDVPVAESADTGAAVHDGQPRLTTKLILWLGISGGIVPCPAATWMMLAAVAQDMTPLGLFAVGVFSLGLALTLMTVGFLALTSRRFATSMMGEQGTQRWFLTILPTLGGAAVLLLGGAISAHYAWALAFNEPLIRFFG
jgi:nickel/cobalt exporter